MILCRFRQKSLRLLALLTLALALLAGCAATSTTVLDEEVISNQKHMASYKSLIITEFELKGDQFSDPGDVSARSEREKQYASLPGLLAENVERYVKARQTYQNVSRGGVPTDTTLVLKGRFTRVGRFRISITGTLHDGGNGQEVAYFRQTLWDVFDALEAVNLLSREVADFIDRIQYK